MTTEAELRAARDEAQQAMSRLEAAAKRACPGEHKPTQHRDRQLPWCPNCGRTRYGTTIRKVLQNGFTSRPD